MKRKKKNLPKALVLVLSSPSGGGKTSQAKLLCRKLGFKRSVSVTTREPREGEKDGVDYHFMGRREFFTRVARGEFVEWAEVHGNCYGTLLSTVIAAVKPGKRLVLTIDVNGHAIIKESSNKKLLKALKGVFLMPPSMKELESRLRNRRDTDEATIAKRLRNAPKEMARSGEFHYTIVTHDRDSTFARLAGIVKEHVS